VWLISRKYAAQDTLRERFVVNRKYSKRFAIDRMVWALSRRLTIAKQVPGFWAHWGSYADERCSFSEYNKIYKESMLRNVELGRFSYIRGANSGHCSYGGFCSIGPEAIIGGLGRHPTPWLTTHPSFFSTRVLPGLPFSDTEAFEELVPPTTVGNDVWVGARAIILDGVVVGDGAIVAAGAVVSKNVPPYAVVGGVPARTIRYRFDSEVIEELLDWQWWSLSTEILKRIAPDFISRENWRVDDRYQSIA
jgi:acetyltransferase-like isoleucine patch superfamily enzyme